MTSTHNDTILEVNGLAKRFNIEAGFFSSFGKFVYAVNDVSFAVKQNTALGLVGESSYGKTSTARLLVQVESARLVRCVNPVG